MFAECHRITSHSWQQRRTASAKKNKGPKQPRATATANAASQKANAATLWQHLTPAAGTEPSTALCRGEARDFGAATDNNHQQSQAKEMHIGSSSQTKPEKE